MLVPDAQQAYWPEFPGIGGITTALALARAGFQNIDLYERSATGGFVGAGIQLLPNMVRVLDKLGVWEEIRKDAVLINQLSARRTFPFYSFWKRRLKIFQKPQAMKK